jgi:hypothetical protein
MTVKERLHELVEFVRRCATIAGYGIDHVITSPPGRGPDDAVARLVAAAPALRALPATA